MRLAVTSTSFSCHSVLVETLRNAFPSADIRLNETGRRLEDQALAAFLNGIDGAIVGLEPVDDAILQACPDLKIISKFGVGLDNLDQQACRDRGVTVGWTGGLNRRSVAEMVMGFALSLTRNLYPTSLALKQGSWIKRGGFELSGKTVGIIGFGAIGTEVARLLAPFQCRILANDIADKSREAHDLGVELVDKNTLYSQAQIVTLHTPLTAETHHMVDAEAIKKMCADAILINTARGPIVNQRDLKLALSENRILAAALDVFEVEPPDDSDFIALPNLYCTPHIGGNSAEAVLAMGRSAIRHLEEFFRT